MASTIDKIIIKITPDNKLKMKIKVGKQSRELIMQLLSTSNTRQVPCLFSKIFLIRYGTRTHIFLLKLASLAYRLQNMGRYIVYITNDLSDLSA
ncbi:Uncharacterized protein TCM_021575 [Theobroma cacao]|uniref:Uncharacterized protein n=1 Tax=Theobroma cacao TaxID=3641 RepID=A0A061EXP2_THECC|nr:Uncharacterized protein TCM_021575 [Theobroma cacao]